MKRYIINSNRYTLSIIANNKEYILSHKLFKFPHTEDQIHFTIYWAIGTLITEQIEI